MAAISDRPLPYLVALGLLILCTLLYGVSIFSPGWITYHETNTTSVSKSMWERDLVLCLDNTSDISKCRRIYPSKDWLVFGLVQEVIGLGLLLLASAYALFINLARKYIVTSYISEILTMAGFVAGCFGQMTYTSEVHVALNITFSWAYFLHTIAFVQAYFIAVVMAVNNDPPSPK